MTSHISNPFQWRSQKFALGVQIHNVVQKAPFTPAFVGELKTQLHLVLRNLGLRGENAPLHPSDFSTDPFPLLLSLLGAI